VSTLLLTLTQVKIKYFINVWEEHIQMIYPISTRWGLYIYIYIFIYIHCHITYVPLQFSASLCHTNSSLSAGYCPSWWYGV